MPAALLQALADGETDPTALAMLAAPRLRATPAQLCDAFHASPTLHPVYRRLLKLTLDELRLIADHLGQLDQQMADLLAAHHDAVQRLAEVPGLGVDSAQQLIAEVGATAATFPSSKHLASWMGACPGAVVYRRIVPRLGHAQAIGAITHRLCRLIWTILHERVRYDERGPAVSVEAKKVRARKMIRELRSLGYQVTRVSPTVQTRSVRNTGRYTLTEIGLRITTCVQQAHIGAGRSGRRVSCVSLRDRGVSATRRRIDPTHTPSRR